MFWQMWARNQQENKFLSYLHQGEDKWQEVVSRIPREIVYERNLEFIIQG